MMSAPIISCTTPVLRPSLRAACSVEDPRLRLWLKPEAPTTGWADGGWWPRSPNLAAKLPGLLSACGSHGRIERVSYYFGECGPTLHKICSVPARSRPRSSVSTDGQWEAHCSAGRSTAVG
jgi:hypothetical protein